MKFRKKKQLPARQGTRRSAAPRGREVSVFSYYAGQPRRSAASSRYGAEPVSSASRPQAASPHHRITLGRFLRHHFQAKYIPTYIACLVFASACLYTLSLSGSPRVVVEKQPGVVQRDPSVYEQHVQAVWRSSVFNRTKLTVNTQQTRQAILDTYHELGDVRIQLPLVGRRATIVLVPIAPSLQIEGHGGTFYVDAEGKALADTSNVTSSSSVPVVQDDGVLGVTPGQLVLPRTQVASIVQLFTEFQAAHISLRSMTLSDKAANQLNVQAEADTYYIKVQLDESTDARQVVGTYVAMQKKFAADGAGPTEYLDLRVPGRAFYK